MTDAPEGGAAPRRSGRWTRIALIVSLCLNVLVIGAVGGFALRHDRGDDRIGGMRHVMRIVPEERRDEARAALAARAPEIEALREEVRAAREETIRLLADEPLDEAALRESVMRAREVSARRRVIFEEALLDFAADLPAAERKALAERLAERRDRWRERRERWRDSREREE